MNQQQVIAYFSMEIGLDPGMPTYSGGLGVLAGDTIRAAADLNIPLVGVTLLHRKGYFYQRLEPNGVQKEEPVEWAINDFVQQMPQRVSISLEGRNVTVGCWKYEVQGNAETVAVYFLDTHLPENSEWDQTLTDTLYGGDQRYRLCQEVVLGIGGLRMLRALGYNIERFHMNEGHSSLIALELLEEEARKANRESITTEEVEKVRRMCVFTTHTPVQAGQDQFPLDLIELVLGKRPAFERQDVFCCEDRLNMTYLALNLSHYVNGVAKRHGEVTRLMYAHYKIDAITNGVHAATWTSPPFQDLYDRHIPGWRQDNFSLRYALSIPKQEVWQAHVQAKKRLLQYINEETNSGMDRDIFTIGFARRAAAYKRADLLFYDVERLRKIASASGPIQIIYAGKAHPQDQAGKEVILRVFRAIESLAKDIKIAYLENYDIEKAKLITSGVDLWLNTPQPPMEASGTSGMKAALNGIPSLSILDGWWIEGNIEGITGWAIGEDQRRTGRPKESAADAASLYNKLEQVILPLFYQDRDRYLNVMLHAIALNGSFFNTQRMIQQYVLNAYFR